MRLRLLVEMERTGMLRPKLTRLLQLVSSLVGPLNLGTQSLKDRGHSLSPGKCVRRGWNRECIVTEVKAGGKPANCTCSALG